MNDNATKDALIFVIGFVMGIITLMIAQSPYPETSRASKKLLNSGRYTIDTTMLVHGSDTTYNYKFIKIK